MREELTTKMHSEFSVSASTDTKHKVWCIIERAKAENKEASELFDTYGINKADFEEHKDSYLK